MTLLQDDDGKLYDPEFMFPEPRCFDVTSLLYQAETQLLNELRHEGYVQESHVEDPPEGVLRVFLRYPITNTSGQYDEGNVPDTIIINPGMVYIVKAVTKPSRSPAGELEFGVQRRHIKTLREILERYRSSTPDKEGGARVYWYISNDGQYRYIDLDALDSLGRVTESENIHGGGTIFIQVYKTIPMKDYHNDPYRADREKFLPGVKRPESTEWFG